ncbi:unnamed protein product [Porites evermanni]|uniref:Major facilitator superfamily (MFS) profile domain-containing protein n=1 Tax=Porites evermanni TaxID=104178 RepID=A0ABN8R0G0_9CNID|nr:unnamed protein product [Porites evermanni]
MLDNFFKGDIPSIFETTIKREKGKSADNSTTSKLKDYRNEEEFLKSVTATICYCGSFWTFGMAAAVIGPTLLELGCVTNRPVNVMSWVFLSQALSALFGSSLGGFLADRYDCNVILLYCVTSVAVYLAIIPVCHVFGIMLAFFALLGVHMGIIDTVANSILIKIHGKKVAPRLQSLHFFYGLGALVSPVIAEPFLRSACADGHFQSNIFGWTLENSTLESYITYNVDGVKFNVTMLNDTVSRVSLPRHYHTKSFVQYAYWLVALLQVPVQSGLFYLIYRQRYLRRWAPEMFARRVVTLAALPAGNGDETESEDLPQVFKSMADHSSIRLSFCSLPAKIPLVTLLAGLLLFLFDGLQGAFGGYVYTYAVKSEVDLSSSHAAYLNSLFWCSFAAGRFISILISVFLVPDKMLFVNLFGSFTAISVMLYLHQFPLSLWIGTGAFGLFMSSVFPTTLALAEYYIDVTGSITSILIVSSATGEMVFPLLVGKAFARDGPYSFLVIGFLICTFALLVFLILRMTARAQLNQSVHDLYRCAVKRLCHCNQACDDCEYTPLVTCEEGEENAGNEEPVRSEPVHRVAELQS